MRPRRRYLRVGLSGLAFLALMTAVLWLLHAPAAWAFLILTYYWVALCLVVGLVLLLASALRRLADPS